MPGLPVVLHPDAVEEAQAAWQWYLERSQSAAEAPERWPLFVHGTRRFLFRRFPFQIVYRVANDRIEVVAIAHGRRKPGYWKTR